MSMIKSIIATIVLIVVIIGGSVLFSRNYNIYTPDDALTQAKINSAYDLLNDSLRQPRQTYWDYLNQQSTTASAVDADFFIATTTGNPVMLGKNGISEYSFTADRDGFIQLAIAYRVPVQNLNNYTIMFQVDGVLPFDEAARVSLPIHWQDATKDFDTDRYGDEVIPLQNYVTDWRTVSFFDNLYQTVDPLKVFVTAGSHTIRVTNLSAEQVEVNQLTVKAVENRPTYQQYSLAHPTTGVDFESTIDAIDYIEKNSSYARLLAFNNTSLTPFDPVYKKINIIDGASWNEAGQALNYQITVPNSGRYHLAFYYMNDKSDLSVFRSIAIDGEIPFKEFEAYEFKPTGKIEWRHETLRNSNEPFGIYLTAGTHTITIRAEKEPLSRALRKVQLLSDHINQFTLDIKKITGKDVDQERTWKLTQYIPETASYLDAYQTILQSIVKDIMDYAPNGANSAALSPIQRSLYKIIMMLEDPDELPLYLDDLSGSTSSVALNLGNLLTTIDKQPLFFDQFTVYRNLVPEAPRATLWDNMTSGVRSFLASFTSNKYRLVDDPETVEIWVNRPITYVDMMQKMADAQFTAETGIKVKISVMQDINKLVMASAADQQPDIALGLPSYMPYDLAIRNAAYDLTSFDDYWSVAQQFSPGAFVPYILNERAYALPETLDFNVLVYRNDIFDSFNLDVPDTWYDVIDLLPELQRYGMNFYHPIAGGGALKWFYQTSSLLMQFGGELYSPDGLTTAIDDPRSVQGLTFLNRLFTNYSLPEQVGSFYNEFRYGTLPVGIADFSTYLLLKNAAPEIIGKWDIAPYPGIETNGEISRYYIANGTGGIITAESDYAAESWEFLKWWMSEEIQTQFAFQLQSTYGINYVWLSANLAAVENSPLDQDDKEVILEQVPWLRDVPRTPGQYMLERSISDIWNKAVFDGVPTGVAIDRYTIIIDREIRRKMIEFGFLNADGTLKQDYVIRDIDWIRAQMEAAPAFGG